LCPIRQERIHLFLSSENYCHSISFLLCNILPIYCFSLDLGLSVGHFSLDLCPKTSLLLYIGSSLGWKLICLLCNLLTSYKVFIFKIHLLFFSSFFYSLALFLYSHLICHYFTHIAKHTGLAITICICILDVPDSNFGWRTGYLTKVFNCFLSYTRQMPGQRPD
jgi:hypothetical protein